MKLSEILFEVMQTEPPEGHIVVVSIEDQRSIWVRIGTKIFTSRFPEGRYKYAGQMHIERGITVENNGLVWEVESVYANKGYGPMLYDIGMEVINLVGGSGLMPDRRSVSPEARNVWRTYFEDREDVGRNPLPEDMFTTEKMKDRPEYLRYYYFKQGTPLINNLKAKGMLESDFL